jgi:hypothetical protein
VPRPRGLPLLACALVLGGGALAAGAITGGGAPVLRVAGGDRPVNVGAGDLSDISAHNSPTLARHPRDASTLAVSSRIDSPDFSCAVHVSRDGGARWRRLRVPVPRGRPKCYAPDLAFGADGRLHVSYVTLRGTGNVPDAVWLATSSDGGRTLGPARRVSGPLAFQVRLAADPARAGRLHLTWLQASEVGPLRFTRTGDPIVAARSDDGGRTWGRPVRISSAARERVLAPTPSVGQGGVLHVLYVDVGDDRLDFHGGHDGLGGPPYDGRFALVLARAADGGRRWQESVVADDVVPIERFVAFLPPFPALALAPGGEIYAAYHDGRHGSADVLLWALDRGATGWRGPVRVNDTPAGDRTVQRLPQVAVAPDGRVDVAYQDRRGDPRGAMAETSLQSSRDGGRSFGESARVSDRPFDARIGLGSERDMPDLGSRLGLVAEADAALVVWPDTRAGTDASNKQDLRLALASPAASEVRETARAAGLAMAAGGLAAGLLALRRRPRSDP